MAKITHESMAYESIDQAEQRIQKKIDAFMQSPG